MTIIKIEKRADPYARIDNRTLQDRRLSLKATGLLAFLLSLPPDWHIVLQHLSNMKRSGRYSTQSALNELKRYSYAKFDRPRDSQGRFDGSVWRIFERPFTEKQVFPLPEKSGSRENPILGENRFSDKSAATNEIPSTPNTNKRTSTKLLAPDGEQDLLDQIRELLGEAEMHPKTTALINPPRHDMIVGRQHIFVAFIEQDSKNRKTSKFRSRLQKMSERLSIRK